MTTTDKPIRYRRMGLWRIGPVVFDWSGTTSVAQCEACGWSTLSTDGALWVAARRHARDTHDVEPAVEVLL